MSKTTIMMLIVSLLALLIFTGCPVDDESKGDSSENADGRKPGVSHTQDDPATDETPDVEEVPDVEENLDADENPANEENVDGEETPVTDEEPGDEETPDVDENADGEDTPVAEEEPVAIDEPTTDENITTVVLETTKGDITLDIHHDWAPIGAAHYIELVEDGFYDGAPWFRVIPGFMCQTGIAADPKVTAKWQRQTIQDEKVIQGNLRGTVSFGKSGMPNSRSTHIFINYKDNRGSLDGQGFSAFAEVVKGMDVADSLFATGEVARDFQPLLSQRGSEGFLERYPDGDFINKAYIKE